MNNISIIIPVYKEFNYLDLAITSIVKGQIDKNQIIPIIDGTYEDNKDVLNKWKNEIDPIIFEQTMGQSTATNYGCYNALHDKILIINSDNVVCKNFDKILLENYQSRTIICPNQIEPRPSIFKSFIIHNFGQTVEEFDLNNFQQEELKYRQNKLQDDGYTLPIFMDRNDYISVGGWDERFPSGLVTDLDFFYKCKLNGFKFQRNMKLNFYHFSGASMKSKEKIEQSKKDERLGFEYFFYKWKKYPQYDKELNFKFD